MNDSSLIRTYAGQPPIAILGVPFDQISAEEFAGLIERMIASRRAHYLVTADVSFLVRAQSDAELRRVLFEANLVLCEGAPLLRASRWLGNSLPDCVSASGLLPLLLRAAAAKQWKLFLLGEDEDTVERAVAKLKSLHAGIQFCGSLAAPARGLAAGTAPELAERLREVGADVLLVACDSPAQEKWIHDRHGAFGVPVTVGVASAAALAAGRLERRAGDFSRRPGDLIVFTLGVAKQWWQLQFRSPKIRAQVSTPVQAEETWQCIKLPPRLDLQATRDDALLVDQVLADGRHCLLDLSAVQFIDSTGVGLLIRLRKKIRASGKQLVLLSPSRTVSRALELMRLQDFFSCADDVASARELVAAREAAEHLTISTPKAAPDQPLAWPDEVCVANADAVWSLTEAHILAAAGAGGDAVIELRAVRLLDRTGAQLMVRARKLARREGRRLRFALPNEAVLAVLRAERVEEFVLGD